MVDLTLDSEDEGRIKAGSKSSQKARGGLSLKKESRPQAKVSLPHGVLSHRRLALTSWGYWRIQSFVLST